MYALTDSRIKSLLLNGLSGEERKKFKSLPVESQVEILDTLNNKARQIERNQMEQRMQEQQFEERRNLYPEGTQPPRRAIASVDIPNEPSQKVELPEQKVEVPYKTPTSPDAKNLSEVSKMDSLEYARYYLEQQRLKEEKDRALNQEIENRIQAIQNMRI